MHPLFLAQQKIIQLLQHSVKLSLEADVVDVEVPKNNSAAASKVPQEAAKRARVVRTQLKEATSASDCITRKAMMVPGFYEALQQTPMNLFGRTDGEISYQSELSQ